MRDLINIITEKSRGLLYRSAGDTFFQGKLDNPTAVITFDKAEYFPAMPGAYNDYNEMAEVGQELFKRFPAIAWFNKPTNASRAFAILSFDGPGEGQQTYFGKFFNEIKPDMQGFWKNNELPGGWQLNKSASLKGAYFKLKPADLFPPDSRFDSAGEILQALQANPDPIVQKIVPGVQQLLNGALPVFQDTKEMESAVRDDLGEIIGPMALSLGMNLGTGAEAARVDILGPNGSYVGSSINFPASKTNGLVDSYIYTADGTEIGISSKGEKGATASIKNVSDGIKIATEEGMTDVLDQYAEQIQVINDVGSLAAKDFPIRWGIKNNMINLAQSSHILDYIKVGAKSLDDLQIPAQDRAVFEELMTDIKPTANPRYNVGYHIIACLARRIVDMINKDPKFGKACLTFLNISPIIQLHLQSRTTGTDVAITGFTSKYPPNFNGTVALDASKVYYATGINGRCTFAYNGGGGDTNDAEGEVGDEPAGPKKTLKAPDTSMSADKITKPGRKPETRSTTKGVGRERR
jgi:hypothetical protein